ncbi:hypothetical protein [Vibrio sp. D431a]|uniref:hypothetical protein n=1 Tax=Vibrio sp. D431a TaxID=2837388 RepID=UPI002556BD19|nr:hypothetical protein [Vibrio sp. D431a]MDK9789835.1 hypothetical protein [Vibrio sp. D431a]
MILKCLSVIGTEQIRLTKTIYEQVIKLAGTSKFSKAQVVIERAIAVTQELMKDKSEGVQFYEVDATGEKFSCNFVFEIPEIKEMAEERQRVSRSIYEDVCGLTASKTINEALPHLQLALNVYQLIFDSVDKGSKFFSVDAQGNTCQIKFI